MEISEARLADVPDIAALMTSCFIDDPVMRQFFANGKTRAEAMYKVFAVELEKYYIPRGVVDIVRNVDDHAGLLGTSLWAKPDTPMRRRDELAMLPVMARALGRHFFQYSHLDRYDSDAAPRFAHWYLYTVAVSPAAQGMGIGGQLLDHGIARAGDTPIYLESTTEGSQKLYERKGFLPLGIIPSPIEAPEVGMWRPGHVAGFRRKK